MLLFVNRRGRVLVTQTDLQLVSSFRLVELDQQINAIVTETSVTPQPRIQLQGTLGGDSFINVFGEDPMQIQINGMVVGRSCDEFFATQSALGVGIELFRQHGIVNRVMPLVYTISGQESREAFMVALSVRQQTSFVDMAEFSMVLLARSLQARRPTPRPLPRVRPSGQSPDVVEIDNTGLVGFTSVPRLPAAVRVSELSVSQTGDPVSPQTVTLSSIGYVPPDQPFGF